jgi:purine-nucleoside phosphorylase
MVQRLVLAVMLVMLWVLPVRADPSPLDVLREYAHHGPGERLNTPADEIAWLKTSQLTHGELDDFPRAAVILHRVDVEAYLKALGFAGTYTSFAYGFTDPVVVYIVRKSGMAPFAVARGLPGAGGVTTIAAELHAMGVDTIVHVGTAGLLSPEVAYGQLIIADGSYKDGAAFLLDDDPTRQIARPAPDLTDRIAQIIADDGLPHARAVGFTMPIYYFQPASVLRELLAVTGPDKPAFVEMEEASLFAVCRLMGVRAASVVVASDRLENHGGTLAQGFWDGDLDALERQAFAEVIRAIAPARP